MVANIHLVLLIRSTLEYLINLCPRFGHVSSRQSMPSRKSFLLNVYFLVQGQKNTTDLLHSVNQECIPLPQSEGFLK